MAGRQQTTDYGQLTTDIGLLEFLSAVGTEGKIPLHCSSAGRADILRRRLLKIGAWAVFINDGITIFA
jgi:hypothetical protein